MDRLDEPEGPPPRVCHLVKWPDFDGYGFNLHAEKSKPGQFIGKVDEDSPASLAGLQEGDKIVEVNSVNISNENHRQVVERIKSIPNETRLLVVDPVAERWYKENKVIPRSTQGNVIIQKTPAIRPGAAKRISTINDEEMRPNSVSPQPPQQESNRNGNNHHDESHEIEEEQDGGDHRRVNGINGSASLSSSIDEGLQRVSLDPQPQTPPPAIHHHNGERVHVVELERVNSSNSNPRSTSERIPNAVTDSPRSNKSVGGSSSGRGSSQANGISTTSKPVSPTPPTGHMVSSHVTNGNHNGHHNSVVNGNGHSNGLSRSDSTNTGSDAGSSETGKSSSNHSSIDTATLRTMQVEDILSLNLTASQVRELIASRKRRDPKKEPLDLRQKYDIIQQL